MGIHREAPDWLAEPRTPRDFPPDLHPEAPGCLRCRRGAPESRRRTAAIRRIDRDPGGQRWPPSRSGPPRRLFRPALSGARAYNDCAASARFVYPAPNCCRQIDAFAWSLADGTPVAIHQVIDDHSRKAMATLVADGETAKAAVQVVSTAVRRWGVPQRLLSDNGLAFNPTRRGFTGKLVDYLVDLGVKPITGKPDRPTTQGKNERFHQTLQKWLNARPPVRTIAALQALVDEFDRYYNHERAHQSLGGKTPAEAWAATEPAPEPTAEPRMPSIPPLGAQHHAEHHDCGRPPQQDTAGPPHGRGEHHLEDQAERADHSAELSVLRRHEPGRAAGARPVEREDRGDLHPRR